MCPTEGGPAAEASENGALLGRAELRGMLDLEEKAERTIIIASDMLMCHDVEKGLCLILLFQSCKKKWEGDLVTKDNETGTSLAGLDIFSMKNHAEACVDATELFWHWVGKICVWEGGGWGDVISEMVLYCFVSYLKFRKF